MFPRRHSARSGTTTRLWRVKPTLTTTNLPPSHFTLKHDELLCVNVTKERNNEPDAPLRWFSANILPTSTAGDVWGCATLWCLTAG